MTSSPSAVANDTAEVVSTDAATSAHEAPMRSEPAVNEPAAIRTELVAARSLRRWTAVGKEILPPLLALTALTLCWLFVSYEVLEPRRRFLLPPPQDVFSDGMLNPRNRSELLQGLWATARVSVTGFLIATVIGVLTAILMSQARSIERVVYPYAVFLQTVPIIAIVPLVGFWWGFDFKSRVLVCVIISVFPILTNTLFGLQSADQSAHDIFTIARAGRLRRLLKLELPTALPAMFTGLRIAAGASVIGAIVGDFFFRQGEAGIGRLIDNYTANLQSELLLMAVFLSALLGISMFWGVGFVGQLLTGKWADGRRGKRGAHK